MELENENDIEISVSEKEIKRLKNMMEYDLDYEFNSEELYSIVEFATFITGLPHAYISIIGIKNTNILASIGSGIHTINTFNSQNQIFPREKSLSNFCIEQEGYLEIKDTFLDERTKDLYSQEITSDPAAIRYYGGCPLKSKEGYNLGSLSVCGPQPFELEETSKESLQTLADQVMVQFQLKRQKRQLREATLKAEKLSKANEDFLSNIGFELLTPLNSIHGYAEILNITKLDNEQQEAIQTIIDSSRNLITNISGVLDSAKINCEKLVLEKNPFNLKKTVNVASDLLQKNAIQNNIKLETIFDENIPKKIIGDKIRINQIIMNIAGNAVKMCQNGIITIHVRIFDETENDITLNFSVRDTNNGNVCNTNSMFERIEKLGSDCDKTIEEIGYDSNLSKNLVELHGGQLKSKSIIGQGSEFYFTIKYEKIKNNQEERIKAEFEKLKQDLVQNNLKKLRILICEDNFVNIKLYRRIFTGKVSHLEIAENGKIAIEILKTKNFDIILMNINMPEMDGLQTTEYIRNNLGLTLPIIGLTNAISQKERERCLKIGMSDYINKSFISEELYEKMSSIILNKKIFAEDFIFSQDSSDTYKFTQRSYSRRPNKYLTASQIPVKIDKNNCDENVDKIISKTGNKKSSSSKQLYSFNDNKAIKSFLKSTKILQIYSYKNYVNKTSKSSSEDESGFLSDLENFKQLKLGLIREECSYTHIKLDFLKEFSNGDLSLEKDIIDLFLSNFPTEFEILLNEILSANLNQIKFWIHRMKSSLSIFDLQLIITDMENIQNLCENENFDTALKRFEYIKIQLNLVYEELEKVRSCEYNTLNL